MEGNKGCLQSSKTPSRGTQGPGNSFSVVQRICSELVNNSGRRVSSSDFGEKSGAPNTEKAVTWLTSESVLMATSFQTELIQLESEWYHILHHLDNRDNSISNQELFIRLPPVRCSVLAKSRGTGNRAYDNAAPSRLVMCHPMV